MGLLATFRDMEHFDSRKAQKVLLGTSAEMLKYVKIRITLEENVASKFIKQNHLNLILDSEYCNIESSDPDLNNCGTHDGIRIKMK